MKPLVNLAECDGNVFAMLAACRRALKTAGLSDQATELQTRVFNAGGYAEAVQLMSEYVRVR